MIRASAQRRVYRPALIERPSMKKFVVLSILLHIWAVALLGDAVGTAVQGAKWGSTFMASLRQGSAALPTTSPTTPLQTKKTVAATKPPSSPQPTEETNQTNPAPKNNAVPINIEPIPVIAVETDKPTQDFVIPTLAVAPLDTPTPATTSTTFAAVPLLVPRSIAPVSESSAVLYVPPIIERATIKLADTEAVIPTLAVPTLATPPQASREFLTYTPPAPAPTPTTVQVPVATVTPPLVVPPVTPPVLSPPPLPAITPIEKLAVPQVSASEFMPKVETLSPSPSQTNVKAESINAPPMATPAPTVSSVQGNDKNSVADKGAATVRPTNADGASSLLPVIPVVPIAPPLPPTAAPKLDLDSLRQRARSIDSESARTLLPFPTVAKPADKRNIEKIFDKALKRPDCKDEYANMGLAAVVPLVRDAIKGDGCKW
jgi:hypothetical protein